MSNETQWTPGPWEVLMHETRVGADCEIRNYPCVHSPEPRASGSNVICAFYDSREDAGEAAANARLIAAAPEMAELLAELTLDLTVPIMARGKCALLLAKIKGAAHA